MDPDECSTFQVKSSLLQHTSSPKEQKKTFLADFQTSMSSKWGHLSAGHVFKLRPPPQWKPGIL